MYTGHDGYLTSELVIVELFIIKSAGCTISI